MSTGRRHFGSVRRLPSGRWQVSWWHEGERHLADKTFSMKADALSYLSNIESEMSRGVVIDPRAGRITVRQLAEEWMTSNPGKRSGSLERDDVILRLHVLPVLGARQVGNVTKIDVQSLVTAWSSTRAARTARRQYDVVRALFNYAVETDRIARTPCRSIKLPQVEPLSRPLLGTEEIARIAMETAGAWRPMVWIGGILGLRWGEVAGLELEALDFDCCRLTVARQLGRDGRLAPPKSNAGRRVMSVPTELNDILQEHVRLFCRLEGQSLVFTTELGGALDYTNWRRRVWSPATQRAGLGGASFHDLRRAAATALVAEGVDLKTAQTRLGHSDPRLTIGIYAQASSQSDREAAGRLSRRFFPIEEDR
jgi:integrase